MLIHVDKKCLLFSLFQLLNVREQEEKAKAKAYNTCRTPQVTYRDFRGAGHVTGQASVGRRP